MMDGGQPAAHGPPTGARPDLTIPPGLIVKGRWKITGKLGQGAFGETHAGLDIKDGSTVAIKVERWDNKKMVLKLEVMALKKLQACPYIVKYISSGRQDQFNFLVMERLGENIAELRKRAVNGVFSMSTTLRLGMQMLQAIEGCHNLAYIHRDIKPSNFVMGFGGDTGRPKRCYLIDFGLARKYRAQSGEIRQARRQAGFRGTARYASINSHNSKELSRRDDLWSLFYVLVEFATGGLPWRKLKDKDEIGRLKEHYTKPDLCSNIPGGGQELVKFMEHLNQLSYSADPNYSYLHSLLEEMWVRTASSNDAPYDWEVNGHHMALPVPATPHDRLDDRHRHDDAEPIRTPTKPLSPRDDNDDDVNKMSSQPMQDSDRDGLDDRGDQGQVHPPTSHTMAQSAASGTGKFRDPVFDSIETRTGAAVAAPTGVGNTHTATAHTLPTHTAAGLTGRTATNPNGDSVVQQSTAGRTQPNGGRQNDQNKKLGCKCTLM